MRFSRYTPFISGLILPEAEVGLRLPPDPLIVIPYTPTPLLFGFVFVSAILVEPPVFTEILPSIPVVVNTHFHPSQARRSTFLSQPPVEADKLSPSTIVSSRPPRDLTRKATIVTNVRDQGPDVSLPSQSLIINQHKVPGRPGRFIVSDIPHFVQDTQKLSPATVVNQNGFYRYPGSVRLSLFHDFGAQPTSINSRPILALRHANGKSIFRGSAQVFGPIGKSDPVEGTERLSIFPLITTQGFKPHSNNSNYVSDIPRLDPQPRSPFSIIVNGRAPKPRGFVWISSLVRDSEKLSPALIVTQKFKIPSRNQSWLGKSFDNSISQAVISDAMIISQPSIPIALRNGNVFISKIIHETSTVRINNLTGAVVYGRARGFYRYPGSVWLSHIGHFDYFGGNVEFDWGTGGVTSGWQLAVKSGWYTTLHCDWTVTIMATTIASASTEYVKVQVVKDDGSNPTTDTVVMAFLLDGVDPQDADWLSADWQTIQDCYYARCLIGPGGTTELVTGTYVVWLKITDNPEIPVKRVDYLEII